MPFVCNFDPSRYFVIRVDRGVLQASGESWRGGEAASLVVYATLAMLPQGDDLDLYYQQQDDSR
jgi:hypothetical protein